DYYCVMWHKTAWVF
nr:immunoglobulin light chain junction region [Macaca mulatta]MOY07332.1 immunoglobulin light chain junction region [Macaca mulatta]MOY08533.1 immunoglobulin light chain junction region [Macaca mulatta]MOY09647.1 immunoglobulin light chain junction region [Macaca mulatta]